MEHRYFKHREELHKLTVTRHDGGAQARIKWEPPAAGEAGKEKEFEITCHPVDEHTMFLAIEGKLLPVTSVRQGHDIYLHLPEETYHLSEEDAASSLGEGHAATDSHPSVTAPMPAKVVKLLVAVGQSVTRGQAAVILDSMKLEIELKAAVDGVVESILVKEGQQLAMGQEIMTFAATAP